MSSFLGATRNSRRLQRQRLLSASLVGILTIVLGTAAVVWHARAMLHREASLNAMKVLQHIELMLGNARQAALTAGRWSTAGCPQALASLRELVQATLYVRSLNLVDPASRLYCSSLLGTADEHIDANDYAQGQLRLIHGNLVTPDSPVLLYRHATATGAVVVGVDGRHVTNLMDLIPGHPILKVRVGNISLSSASPEGPDELRPPPATVVSRQFPVQVYAASAPGALARALLHDYVGLLALFLLLGGISAARTYWLLGRRSSAKTEMMRALVQSEFVAYMQPLVRADSLRWAGAEVLVRSVHPNEGIISPNLFVPAAERNGLILPITKALMQQVAAALEHLALPAGFQVSINISKAHLHASSFIEDCGNFLERTRSSRVKLVLELTERDLIIADQATRDAFGALREKGIQLAIDDFGTGYSSLSYLQEFNVDELKIDRAFISKLGENALSQELVLNILDLGRRLGLKTVAEGVETEQQSAFLREQNIDLLQGFLFSPPVPLEDFVKQLSARA